jgi:pilus assembly protein CpaC
MLAALSCLWLSSSVAVRADEAASGAPVVKSSSSVTLIGMADGVQGALLNMRIGRPLSIPLPPGAKYVLSGDATLVKAERQKERLVIVASGTGRVELVVTLPSKIGETATTQKYALHIADANGVYHDEPNAIEKLETIFGKNKAGSPDGIGSAVITPGVGEMRIPPRQPALTTAAASADSAVASAPTLGEALRTFVAAPRATAPRSAPRVAAKAGKGSTVKGSARLASNLETGIGPKSGARVMAKAMARTTTAPVLLASVISSNTTLTPERLAIAEKADPQIIAHSQIVPDLPILSRPGKVPSGGINAVATPAYTPPQSDGRTPGSGAAVSAVAATTTTAAVATDDLGVNNSDVVITPNVMPPSTLPASGATYPTQSQLPPSLGDLATARRPLYNVTQGMARLLAFKSNILSVFFSDDNVMDARAVNARTIAVTGKGPGKSTLAVFLSRYDGDVVGRAVIYNIQVYPTVARATPVGFTDPAEAENAIRTALNDPRVRVAVLQRPDGSLVAQLSGGLHDRAEVDASVAIASLFVPNVISSLYVDAQAPTLEQALNGPSLSGDELLQKKLRDLLNNDTIEIVSLPGGAAIKATVDSPAEAENILSILPSLSRKIQPFIVVRGAPQGFYDPEHPILYGEDHEMTRRLHEVTGVSSVYVVRTARNALAVYGTVRNRVEYDTVRRYANTLLPQLQESVSTAQTAVAPNAPGAVVPPSTTATTTSVAASAPALAAAAGTAPSPATAPLTGLTGANVPGSKLEAPVQIQMFVRVLDEDAGSVRLVTVESSVVEISRNALKDLGVQVGSATLLGENITPGTPATTTSGPGGTVSSTGTPSVITRTVDPTFNQGEGLFGSFIGTGEFSNINPLRVRLNALMQSGAARVLSRPNVTAVEGADAQITIGGVRPVPSSQTNSSGGATQTTVEFRRYGIILTMRPTLTDDDTIILQIRGDVTNLDPTTAINLSGAIIPGELVRSVDTTVTMHEGDTLVLGGLITNEARKQTSKVPILGDLPILGSLFRSKRFENNETELAIFLSPHIRRQHASVNTKAGVEMVPSLPDLPGLQDQQKNAFGLSTAGTGG